MRQFWKQMLRNPSGLMGLIILVIAIFLAVLGPMVFPNSPWRMVQRPFLPPFTLSAVPLGTDALGRDVFAGIIYGARVSRLVGGEVLSLRTREYVQAAIVTGQTSSWIIWHEILPNALSPVIVLASLMVATAILLESSLSFLGLGDPNLISWGYMVGAGRTVIRQAWWITVFPGLAILVSVLGLNLVGEGLNDALNPRLARDGR